MKDLVAGDSPILTGVSSSVGEGENIDRLVYYLRKMRDKHNALGIAAPQIGVPKRVIIFKGVVAVNPSWIDAGREPDTESDLEGCLSFPGQYFTVRRYKYINVTYHEYMGAHRDLKLVNVRLVDLAARVFQHECDHLDGQLVTRFESALLDSGDNKGPV